VKKELFLFLRLEDYYFIANRILCLCVNEYKNEYTFTVATAKNLFSPKDSPSFRWIFTLNTL